MNMFEANKIAGAILMSLLIIVVIGHIGNFLVPIPKAAHDAAVAAHGESGGAAQQHAAAAPAAPDQPIAELLKTASPEEGAKLFKVCAACHTAEKGGPNKVGPNLWNIVGDKKAHVAGFAFSDAMQKSPGDWSYEALNEFLTKPSAYVPGTKMTFQGFRDAKQRADVIAYLRTLSDSPKPLP
ncbi:MAG: cytochrome c family protein [Alphaproteobacteria bacterium]